MCSPVPTSGIQDIFKSMTAPTPTDIETVLVAWNLGDVLTITRPTTGTVHQTFLVQTGTGDYVVRAYRYSDRQRVENEHALIFYAQEQDLPAVAPLPVPGGRTILEQAGRFFAVFPCAAGQQREGKDLGPGDVTAMGRCLAALHRALIGFPPTRVCPRSLAVETEASGFSMRPPQRRSIPHLTRKLASFGLHQPHMWAKKGVEYLTTPHLVGSGDRCVLKPDASGPRLRPPRRPAPPSLIIYEPCVPPPTLA